MAHVYADLTAFKQYLVDDATSMGTGSDPDLLIALESASRTIDAHCQRTHKDFPMSGFGPRLGVNRYDGTYSGDLELKDDLLTVTTVTNGSTTLTDNTSFFKYPYDAPRFRYLLSPTVTPSLIWTNTNRRAISVTGKWGYQDVQVLCSQLNGALAAVTTTTTITLDTAVIPGQTLLIGSEQLYVRSVSGLTASCDRGCNGTTAAIQADDSPVSRYQYPANVVRCCLVIAGRRRKSRDAGLSGNFGGVAGMPTTFDPERSERWVLDDYLNEFKFALVA